MGCASSVCGKSNTSEPKKTDQGSSDNKNQQDPNNNNHLPDNLDDNLKIEHKGQQQKNNDPQNQSNQKIEVKDNLLYSEKATIRNQIAKNDPFITKRLLQKISFEQPIGDKGNYTLLHHAAYCDSYKTLEILIEHVKKHHSNSILKKCNIVDDAGNTPAMIAADKKNASSLYVLLKENAVNYGLKNSKQETLKEIIDTSSDPELGIIFNKHAPADLGDIQVKFDARDQSNGSSQNYDQVIANLPYTKMKKQMQHRWKQEEQRRKKIPKQDLELKYGSLLEELDPEGFTYQFLKRAIKTGQQYDDGDFPCELRSICTDMAHECYEKFKASKWKRPDELFGTDFSNIKLFDDIEPGDIQQGIAGVCYYLSALSAIAEYPHRIQPIFANSEANQFGVYGVFFYDTGVKREIVIDDKIPCYGESNIPLFARPKGNELWTLLAEKAWAKFFGNYEVCEAGFMSNAFESLLGCPSVQYINNKLDHEKIWELLAVADHKRYIICAATDPDAQQGLVGGHAYSVISVHDVEGYRLIKLRNPWGKFEWKGDFSDESNLWTDSMKRRVGFQAGDDGIFFMRLEDFHQLFQYFSIAYYEDDWFYECITVDCFKGHANYSEINISEPTEICIRVHQKDVRHFYIQGERNKEYNPCELWLVKVEQNQELTTIVDPLDRDKASVWGARSIYANKDRTLKLNPGKYILRTKLKLTSESESRIGISIYSDKEATIAPINPMKKFLEKALTVQAKQSEGQEIADGVFLHRHWYGPYHFVYFKNDSDGEFAYRIELEKMINCRLGKPLKVADNQIQVDIASGESAIAYLKQIDVGKDTEYKWQWIDQ